MKDSDLVTVGLLNSTLESFGRNLENRILAGVGELIHDAFALIDNRFNILETKVDKLEVKVDRLEVKVNKIDTRLTKVETRLGNIETTLKLAVKRVDNHAIRIEYLEAGRT